MNAMSISNLLNDFLNQSHETILKLHELEKEELANEPDFDGGPYMEFHRQNKQTADTVNQLRTSALAINLHLLGNSSLMSDCNVQQLDTDFCGDGFKEHEYEEDTMTCCEKLAATSYSKTWNEVRKTLAQVKIVEEQGLAMYNYLNPENPRHVPWHRDCIIL